MVTCKIYVLKNPHTNAMFYVGKTVNIIEERLRQHIKSAKDEFTRYDLYRYIGALGEPPIIQVIDTIMVINPNDENAVALEEFWIRGLKGCGLNLLNIYPFKKAGPTTYKLKRERKRKRYP